MILQFKQLEKHENEYYPDNLNLVFPVIPACNF